MYKNYSKLERIFTPPINNTEKFEEIDTQSNDQCYIDIIVKWIGEKQEGVPHELEAKKFYVQITKKESGEIEFLMTHTPDLQSRITFSFIRQPASKKWVSNNSTKVIDKLERFPIMVDLSRSEITLSLRAAVVRCKSISK